MIGKVQEIFGERLILPCGIVKFANQLTNDGLISGKPLQNAGFR